jgi:hypothetical protein
MPKRKRKRKSKRKNARKRGPSVRSAQKEGKALGLAFVRKVKVYANARAKGLSVAKAKKKAGL